MLSKHTQEQIRVRQIRAAKKQIKRALIVGSVVTIFLTMYFVILHNVLILRGF